MIDILTWPFRFTWGLVMWLLEAFGRTSAVIIGLVFMILGVLLTLTLLGAVIGIPLFILGAALVFRGFF